MKQRKNLNAWIVFAGLFTAVPGLNGQGTPLAWDATKNFEFRIDKVSVSADKVKVIISVANPNRTAEFPDLLWNIKTAGPITGGVVRVLLGWEPREYGNMNSRGNLNPVLTIPSSIGAALPVSINALTGPSAAKPCDETNCPGMVAGRFYVTGTVTPMPFPPGATVATGMAAIEGRAVCPTTGPVLPGCPTTGGVATAANVPVKSVVKAFSFIPGGTAVERRKIVDINKCMKCHDDKQHGDSVVPKLSLHGGSRNENLGLCVICHNPSQTDIPYRSAGAEVSIDFKRMVHGIHAGGFRETPLQIVGFQGAGADFSKVRFPASLRNCLNCHIEANGKGTFELPLGAEVLGSTVDTRSVQVTATTPLRQVNVDPADDWRITPTAATCSGCHDKREVRTHMIRTGGASFSILQQNIVPGVTERCVNCHGRGRAKDVRKVHEIGGGDDH